jgi:hypothetical protein
MSVGINVRVRVVRVTVVRVTVVRVVVRVRANVRVSRMSTYSEALQDI